VSQLDQYRDEPYRAGDTFYPERGRPFRCTSAGKIERWTADRIADEDEFDRTPGRYQEVRGVPLSLELLPYAL